MIRRPPRSTLSSSSAASDVYKRQLDDSVSICCGTSCITVRAAARARMVFGKSTAAYFSSALGFGFAVGLFENVNDTVSASGQASGLHLYTRCDLFGAICTSQSPGGARVPTRTSPGLIGTAGLVGPMLISPPVWATEWPETMMKAQSVTART